jgi:hypothetical protein
MVERKRQAEKKRETDKVPKNRERHYEREVERKIIKKSESAYDWCRKERKIE